MNKKGNWIAKLMSKYDKSKITIYNLRQENKQLKEKIDMIRNIVYQEMIDNKITYESLVAIREIVKE